MEFKLLARNMPVKFGVAEEPLPDGSRWSGLDDFLGLLLQRIVTALTDGAVNQEFRK
jgi:hypothetical protein